MTPRGWAETSAANLSSIVIVAAVVEGGEEEEEEETEIVDRGSLDVWTADCDAARYIDGDADVDDDELMGGK